MVLYKWRVPTVSNNNPCYLRRSTTESRATRFKKLVLDIAAERHLLEVAYYSQNANAVCMWGEEHVKEALAEYKHYLAA